MTHMAYAGDVMERVRVRRWPPRMNTLAGFLFYDLTGLPTFVAPGFAAHSGYEFICRRPDRRTLNRHPPS